MFVDTFLLRGFQLNQLTVEFMQALFADILNTGGFWRWLHSVALKVNIRFTNVFPFGRQNSEMMTDGICRIFSGIKIVITFILLSFAKKILTFVKVLEDRTHRKSNRQTLELLFAVVQVVL